MLSRILVTGFPRTVSGRRSAVSVLSVPEIRSHQYQQPSETVNMTSMNPLLTSDRLITSGKSYI